MKRRRRRRLLVNADLQMELVSGPALTFLVGIGILSGILWFVLHDVWILGESMGIPAEHPYFTRLEELQGAAIGATAVTLGGLLASMVYGGLVRTRRIAGPIQVLRDRLADARRGVADPIRPRADDGLRDVLTGFNELVSAGNGSRHGSQH